LQPRRIGPLPVTFISVP